MPGRAVVPEWLVDKDLTVIRQVADPREVGGTGDSIVLSAEESTRWLTPLRVEPTLARGKLPETLELSLRWWKDAKPPVYTVGANGRRVTGRFVKRGKGFAASVATAELFASPPSLPTALEASVETITACCTVWPADGGYGEVWTPRGPQRRIETAWYALDICPGGGGGISMLRETGRDVDHFAADPDRIGAPIDDGGHFDRILAGMWDEHDKLEKVTMAAAVTRREADTTRLCLEGVVEKDKGINTTVACTVFDDLPLVLWRRELLRHKLPEKKSDGKDKKGPDEPIDKMVTVAPGFCAAMAVGSDGRAGGRVLSVEEDRFAVFRPSHAGDWLHRGWRLRHGWVLAERPDRRECMLYLFDRNHAPFLDTSLGPRTMRLAVNWPARAIRPAGGAGFTVAFTAGEACGAGVAGAWVACRRRTGDGGIACAVIGRFRDRAAAPAVAIEAPGGRAETPMCPLRVPGVGVLHTALVHLPEQAVTSPLHITAGGIPARRPT